MRPFAALSIAAALLSACHPSESESNSTTKPAPAPEVPTWARSFGDSYEQTGVRVAVGAGGDIALTGTFSGTIDFGGGELSTVDPTLWGEADLFLALLAPDGTHHWSGATGASDVQEGTGAAVDAEGNATFVGRFQREMDLGAGTMTAAGRDAWMARFSAEGALTWANQSSSKGFDSGVTPSGGVAVGSDGAVVSAGVIAGSTSFGGPPIAGQYTTYVTKLDTAGDHVWSFVLVGYQNTPNAVAIDPSQGAFVVGTNRGEISVGTAVLPFGYPEQGYMASISSDGALQWVIQIDAEGGSAANAVVATADEGALVAGCYTGSAKIGENKFWSTPETTNGFVAKLHRNGAVLRVTNMPSMCVNAIAVDDAGKIHVGGQYTGAPILPAGPLPYAWGRSFLAEIAPSGEIASARTFGLDTESAITGVAARGGDLILSGWFRHTMTIDETALTNDGDTNIFVARTRR